MWLFGMLSRSCFAQRSFYFYHFFPSLLELQQGFWKAFGTNFFNVSTGSPSLL